MHKELTDDMELLTLFIGAFINHFRSGLNAFINSRQIIDGKFLFATSSSSFLFSPVKRVNTTVKPLIGSLNRLYAVS